MAASASNFSPQQQTQQFEVSTTLLSRLKEKCYRFDVMNEEHIQLHDNIKIRLEKLEILYAAMVKKFQTIHNTQKDLLSMYLSFGTEIKRLFDISEKLHALIPDDDEKPNKMDYICDFFEATRVFAGKRELGFKDSAKRGYSSIIEWSKLSKYHPCIVKLCETTPVLLANDQYVLENSAVINITNYKNAGLWCEKIFKYVIRRYQHLSNSIPLTVLEFVYNPTNRNLLQDCIKISNGKFPFHTVTKINQNAVNLTKKAATHTSSKIRRDPSHPLSESEEKSETVKHLEYVMEEKNEIILQQQMIIQEKDDIIIQQNQIVQKKNQTIDELSNTLVWHGQQARARDVEIERLRAEVARLSTCLQVYESLHQ